MTCTTIMDGLVSSTLQNNNVTFFNSLKQYLKSYKDVFYFLPTVKKRLCFHHIIEIKHTRQ